MKSKRRQALRTNELAAQIAQLRDFLVRRWNYCVAALVAVALLIAAGSYWRHSAHALVAEGWTAYERIARGASGDLDRRIEDSRRLADQASDGPLRLAALELAAELAWARATSLDSDMADGKRSELLDQARDAAERIVREFPDRPYAAARARLLLAAVAENRGDAETAGAMYDRVAKGPATTFHTYAAGRKVSLVDRLDPVLILPALPKTQPATSTAPAAATATSP